MALAAVLAALTLGSAAAQPSPPCLPRDILVQRLLDLYQETTVAYGVSADGTLLEVFAGVDGSFTVAKTSLQGYACIVDVGVGWRMGNGSPVRDTSTVLGR